MMVVQSEAVWVFYSCFLFLLQNFCDIFALIATILLLLSLAGGETLNEGLSTSVGYVFCVLPKKICAYVPCIYQNVFYSGKSW